MGGFVVDGFYLFIYFYFYFFTALKLCLSQLLKHLDLSAY